MNLLIFLGGTCNGSSWREELIPLLEYEKIPYFNPVVDNWDEEAIEREIFIKSLPTTIELYVITKEMSGFFSIAEAVDSSNKKPEKTIFLIIEEGFEPSQIKSLNQIKNIIQDNGAYIANSLNEVSYLFKEIKINLKPNLVKNKLKQRRKILGFDEIFNNIEKSFKESKAKLNYEQIFDNSGITDYLKNYSLNIEDLSKDYIKIFYNILKNFTNFPLYKNLDLNNKNDLKFIKESENFKSFLKDNFEDIRTKLVSRKSRVEKIIEDQKNTVVDISDILNKSKLDRISLFFILKDLQDENKIKSFSENIVTIS
jgi:hypothetical protein